MIKTSFQNKVAWEYNAYDFWIKEFGSPEKLAKRMMQNPIAHLKKHATYFERYENVRIANICGSCGKKAIPLALLGADVTVFDISAENQRYALETASAAGVQLLYEVGDVLEIPMDKYEEQFDIVFMEGGVLHYFHDIQVFMHLMKRLLKSGGQMICSDFHPYKKVHDMIAGKEPIESYFTTKIYEGEMAHVPFFPEEIRRNMPKCSYRKYTISEIINAVLECGLMIRRFDEHPWWMDDRFPGEFTLVADKVSERGSKG